MNVVDGRGKNKKEIAKVNKFIVKNWFDKHPNSTIKECCESVNMTYKTVRKHIDSLHNDLIKKEG